MQLIKAMQLLGAHVTLSGVPAEVALTMTHLGITLDVPTAKDPMDVLEQQGVPR
jgi:anti-anti-sigma regulatory factor